MESSQTYAELDRRFKSLTKILLGSEVGPLADYERWLRELLDPTMSVKSSLSGKQVAFSTDRYCKGASFASFDEIKFDRKYPEFGINQIKDFDSLVDALQERICYTGNVILGNSKFVEKSSTVNASHFVYGSSEVETSKYVAHSIVIRDSEMIFGCNVGGDVQFLLMCTAFIGGARCFESGQFSNCTDCYYSYKMDNCSECIFCFNVKNKRYAIGNLELPKEKYLSLKKKLVEEMAQQLHKDKRLPSLFEIAREAGEPREKEKMEIRKKMGKVEVAQIGKVDEVEKAFQNTTALVLGKKLSNVSEYGKWLSRRGKQMLSWESALSGSPVLFGNYGARHMIPKKRVITYEEAEKFGEAIKLSEIEVNGVGLGNAHKKLAGLAFFSPFIFSGNNANVAECASSISATNCFRCISTAYSNKCAYTFVPRYSESAFGGSRLFHCSFCINSHNCSHVTRCFEVEDATNCSDLYYCHNVENCHSCILCFNVKNLSYAIGNVVVGREKFLQIKEIMLKQLQAELEKKKSIELDIFNVGCWKN